MVALVMVLTICLVACVQKSNESSKVSDKIKSEQQVEKHEQITEELIAILEENKGLKELLEKSIEKAKEINPDKVTNPAQSLEEYYEFLDWAAKPMPWNIIKDAEYPTIFESVDQGLDYFYFILDQPLEELEEKGYYFNSLQYTEELQPWLVKYCKEWGKYLSKSDSWTEEYYQQVLKEKRFNLDQGWYEDASNWNSFNNFFSRKLVSKDVRPIAEVENDAVVVSPADAAPQGVWRIDEDSMIVQKDGVTIKSSIFYSIEKLLGEGSEYADSFAGGTLTHTFLNVDDYHRYHFPISGTVKEVRLIQEQDALGGRTIWDEEQKKYLLISDVPGWQSIETRACVIVETEEYGLVAVLPVGMSQISSVNFEDTVKEGAKVQKGDELGYFLFGGSDIVMLFQGSVEFKSQVEADTNGEYGHLLMGEAYGTLSK